MDTKSSSARPHLFLTGKKGVGKSTLVQKLLAGAPGPIGGFLTRRVCLPGFDGPTVHLLRPWTDDAPSNDNLLFYCGDKGKATAQRFDELAAEALRRSNDASLIVMDELGPHEARALGFQAEVRRVLEGDIPVLGVLQEAPSPFLQEIADHPRVQVVRVTEKDRDRLAEILLRAGWAKSPDPALPFFEEI